jgi:hypothetical protein
VTLNNCQIFSIIVKNVNTSKYMTLKIKMTDLLLMAKICSIEKIITKFGKIDSLGFPINITFCLNNLWPYVTFYLILVCSF